MDASGAVKSPKNEKVEPHSSSVTSVSATSSITEQESLKLTGEQRTSKRPRMGWTPHLHKKFRDVVACLGIKNATPKTIMELMDVAGLSHECVASHLKSYRHHLRSLRKDDDAPPTTLQLFDKMPQCLAGTHQVFDEMPSDGMIVGDALSYCALFPPDHDFEKNTLIQLWMADGLVLHKPMERIAGLFCDCCLNKGYFQFSRTNVLTGNALYKFKGDDHVPSHMVRIEGNSNLNNVSPEVSHVSIRLENVLTKDEAEEACLSDKSELKKLELHWSDTQYEDILGYGEVLYSLQPHTSLEELLISCYGGFELPSWICNLAFSELVSVSLFECENCLVLPSLGQLPSLKFLNITDFHKLELIDYDFYGGLGISGYVAFPKLENLTLENMSNLEEWLVYGSFDFPRLIKLTIKHCPKLYSLRTLSCLSSLENLEISHCTMLASCLDGKLRAGVETFIVEECPLITAKHEAPESDEEMETDEAPKTLEDGGQATVDELKELNLGTQEEPRPVYVSASLTQQEE
ncbi:hypothetical protein BVRB_3g057210 [Beta vulgaris subsp. vulgaris]|nr:hypothetical protein BVRB_3g057210 [Beta vulgaris subsp. vulgaris]